MKILPINNNIFCKSKTRKILSASLLTISLLSASIAKSCTKLEKQEKDIVELADTTKTNKKSDVNVVIDDSLNVIEDIIEI